MNNQRERHGCVTSWLWIVICVNIVRVIADAIAMFTSSGNNPWINGVSSILGLCCILGSILLMRWQKLGFYLFIFASIVSAVITIFQLGAVSIYPYVGLISILIWWLILNIKKNGVSAWKLMDNQFDYKHSRHLCQFFLVIAAILLILTIIVSLRTEGYHQDDSNYEFEDTLTYEEIDPIEDEESEYTLKYTLNGECSVEVPNGWHECVRNEDQIFYMANFNMSASVIIVKEEKSTLLSASVTNTKDYAYMVKDMFLSTFGRKGYELLRNYKYKNNSYVVQFTITVDDELLRLSVLSSFKDDWFYYCVFMCNDECYSEYEVYQDHIFDTFFIEQI